MPPQALPLLKKKGLKNIYICGQNLDIKEKERREAKSLGLNILSVVHPSADVSPLARLGEGVFIGAHVAIGPEVEVGDFSQVLSGATVAHHSRVGKFVTIADGTHVGGNVTVGDSSQVGIGVNINKRIIIGRNAAIVSGATVVDHVPDNTVCRLNSEFVPRKPTDNG